LRLRRFIERAGIMKSKLSAAFVAASVALSVATAQADTQFFNRAPFPALSPVVPFPA
jgi:hypothetical protein